MEKKYEPLKIFFGVLLFGGLWGILEATLGTFLHLLKEQECMHVAQLLWSH